MDSMHPSRRARLLEAPDESREKGTKRVRPVLDPNRHIPLLEIRITLSRAYLTTPVYRVETENCYSRKSILEAVRQILWSVDPAIARQISQLIRAKYATLYLQQDTLKSRMLPFKTVEDLSARQYVQWYKNIFESGKLNRDTMRVEIAIDLAHEPLIQLPNRVTAYHRYNLIGENFMGLADGEINVKQYADYLESLAPAASNEARNDGRRPGEFPSRFEWMREAVLTEWGPEAPEGDEMETATSNPAGEAPAFNFDGVALAFRHRADDAPEYNNASTEDADSMDVDG